MGKSKKLREALTSGFCILPFIHLETMPTGECKPCCMYEGNIQIEDNDVEVSLNLNWDSIQEAWDSSTLVDLRNQFRAGRLPEGCRRCWVAEAAGKESKRMVSLHRFEHHLDSDIGHQNYKATPIYLDLKLGNICNLKCRICYSGNSSTWAQEEILLLRKEGDHTLKNETTPYYNNKMGSWPRQRQEFWEATEKWLPWIELLDFSGGEPFMIPEHKKLLKRCIELGDAGHIDLHYNTNGTVYDTELVLLWREFKNVEVMCSIDGIGDRFEYLRHPAKWSKVRDSIDKYHNIKHVDLSICHTVSVHNVAYLPEFLAWVKRYGYNYFINFLYEPDCYNIQFLQAKEKWDVGHTLMESKKHEEEIEQVIQFMEQVHSSNEGMDQARKEFWKKTEQGDKIRGECFTTAFPKMRAILDNEHTN